MINVLKEDYKKINQLRTELLEKRKSRAKNSIGGIKWLLSTDGADPEELKELTELWLKTFYPEYPLPPIEGRTVAVRHPVDDPLPIKRKAL